MSTVSLSVYDFFTNLVLLLGWILSNAAWDILGQTMLAGLPFVALVAREFFEARNSGEDEGSKGLLALNRIETKLYAMLLVYIFCALPLMPVTFAPVNINHAYLNSCGVRMAGGGTTTSVGGSLGGVSPSIPVWWATVHAVSRGITNAMISALPCHTDYLYIRTEIDNTAIQDPVLRSEVARFQVACYGAARSQLFLHSAGLSAAQAKDVDWVGSNYFLTTPGYYDSIQSNRPVYGFAFDPATDSGLGTVPAQGGYPSCQQWWLATGIGLKDRLHAQIDPSLWNSIHAAFTSPSAEDYAIRGLLHTRLGGAQGNAAGVTADIGGGSWWRNIVGGITGLLGARLATIPAEGMKDVMSRALPMVQHLLLMAIVIAIPFVLVISCYSFKVAGLITFSYFGIATMSFWFQLSRWLSNNLTELVYNSQAAQLSFVAGLTSRYDQTVLGLVQVAMQLIFPIFWLAMLGWAGAITGSGIGAALQGGTREAGDAGKKGGALPQDAAIQKLGQRTGK